MSTDMEKIEDIYDRLYQISLQVSELIERELFTELGKYFTKKEQLLNEADEIISKLHNVTGSDRLKNLAEKYQIQERKNIEALSKIKDNTKQELMQTNKNAKLVSAYRPNREDIHGSILDFSE